MDILNLRCTPAEELIVYKEVSTSLSGFSNIRIRKEVSLSVKSLSLLLGLSKETFYKKVGLHVSSPSIFYE